MKKHPWDCDAVPPDPSNSRDKKRAAAPVRWQLPRYRVLLLNNADKDLMFVVRTVMELTRFCRTEATLKMWQAHYDGRALLIVTHKERAELFVELFAARDLKVAIEPS
jgi:ATP-dependent Clp protease adaptor protein ClpS